MTSREMKNNAEIPKILQVVFIVFDLVVEWALFVSFLRNLTKQTT